MKKDNIKILIIIFSVIVILVTLLGYDSDNGIESELLGEDFNNVNEEEVSDEELEEIFDEELLDLIEEI